MGMILPANNVSRVAPNSTAVVKFELGPTIDKIKLVLTGGLLRTHIGTMVLKANGHIIWTDTSASNMLRHAYHAIIIPQNQLVIDFTEPTSRNGALEQLLSALPSNMVGDLSLEIEILAGAPAAGADIKPVCYYRPPTDNAFISKMMKMTFDVPFVGDRSIFIPTGPLGGILKRVYFEEAAIGQIQRCDIILNQRRIQIADRAQIESEQIAHGKIPQPKMFVQDFVTDGNMSGALNTAYSASGKAPTVEMIMNNASIGVVTAYFNYLDPINRT